MTESERLELLERQFVDLKTAIGKMSAVQGYLKKDQAAEYAGVSPGTIHNWWRRGLIGKYVTDGNTLYKISEIDAYLDKLRIGGK